MDTRSRGTGTKGKEGQVAFVVWGENGVEETGGFPYRLVFANDDASDITPLVAGLSSQNRQDVLVYGQVCCSITAHPSMLLLIRNSRTIRGTRAHAGA